MIRTSEPKVSVIVLAYGPEPYLDECIRSILDSEKVEVEVLLVDNGSSSVKKLPIDARLMIISPDENTGFAGGCNLGALEAKNDYLVFVNSDLLVEQGAIFQIIQRLNNREVGAVTGAVLLEGQNEIVNTVGNPIHYLFFSWAGSMGEDISLHQEACEVSGFSGALFALTKKLWENLEGFDETYFAYNEDVDLSVRIRQAGMRIEYEPEARGVHYYSFSRNKNKWFLVERNRLINLFTLYSEKSLVLLLPIICVVEIGVLVTSMRNGWWREKLSAWSWVTKNRRYLALRRQQVDRNKIGVKGNWTRFLHSKIEIPEGFGMHVPKFVNIFLAAYWKGVRRFID